MEQYWLNESKKHSKNNNEPDNIVNPSLQILIGDDRKRYISVIKDSNKVKGYFNVFNFERLSELKSLHTQEDITNWAGTAISNFYDQFEIYSTHLAKAFNTIYQTNGMKTQITTSLRYEQIIKIVKSIDALNYLFGHQIDYFLQTNYIVSELKSDNAKEYEQLLNVAKLMKDITNQSFMNLFNHTDTDFNTAFMNWNLAIYQLGIMSLNKAEFKLKYGMSKSKVLKKYPELIG